jgi:poly-gamma-glutamate synthesis protein (capsule biosynthesis protein)
MKIHTYNWLRLRAASLVAIAMTACCCTGNAQSGSVEATAEQEPEYHQVRLIFGGDLMQHEPQIKAARQADGTYDYSGVFDYMAPIVKDADIAIANFEVTLGGPPYKGYPQFCAPDAYLQAAIDCGFDVLTTCNNHSVDTRGRGIDRTITMMDSLGVRHLGTYRNQAERDKLYPFIIEHDDIRICLLNYTYGTNGIPVPSPYIVNLIDTAVIAKDIEKAKAMNPDVIIAMPHWGDEYVLLPNKGQRDLADWMFAHGVDHIIGGHPHVVEPIEVREVNGEKHLLAYSLGNFVSNQSRPNTDGGTMVRMTLVKDQNGTYLTDCGYNLYWVSRPVTSGLRNYRVLPASYPDEKLNATERAKRDNYLRNTRALFAKHNKGIKEDSLQIKD